MAASRAKLLLVEDDDHLRRWVVESLRDADFAVATRGSLAGARGALREPHDLILLNLGLPDGDGLELCRELRAAGDRTPVIVLTACGAPEERVHGLDAGADDYLTKPFHVSELVARIQAVLRRSRPVADGARLSIGEVWVDPETRMAGKGEETLELKRREFDLLHFLQRRQRRNEWVAQVAHDLRTPLAALTTCLDRAGDQLDRGRLEPDELRELLDTARLDAGRVGTPAEDLLEIARLEVEDLVETEPVLPGEIVEHVVRGLQPIATGQGIRCEVAIAPDIPRRRGGWTPDLPGAREPRRQLDPARALRDPRACSRRRREGALRGRGRRAGSAGTGGSGAVQRAQAAAQSRRFRRTGADRRATRGAGARGGDRRSQREGRRCGGLVRDPCFAGVRIPAAIDEGVFPARWSKLYHFGAPSSFPPDAPRIPG